MAQVTGTYSTYDVAGQREELFNLISNTSPEETPFMSGIRTMNLQSRHPEWQTDANATPANNAQVEGDTFAYTAPTATVRPGNYTQTSTKTFLITRTADIVDKAGRDRETAYQKIKQGVELRTDVEVALVSNQASVAGNDTTARQSAGFPAWITSNDSRGAGGADGGFSAGIVAVATNGTQRAFTKVINDTVIIAAYNSGGNVTRVVCSPYVKTVMTTFMSDTNVAAFRYAADTKKNAIIAAADIYLSDFGEIEFFPNRQMARAGAGVARNALYVDPGKIALGWLDPIHEDREVARVSDATPTVLICEFSLIMKNQAAHGIAADLFGLTAST